MGSRASGGARSRTTGVSMSDIIGARSQMASALKDFQKARDDRMKVFLKGKIDSNLVAANKVLESAQRNFEKAQDVYNKKVATFTKGMQIEGVEPSNINPWDT